MRTLIMARSSSEWNERTKPELPRREALRVGCGGVVLPRICWRKGCTPRSGAAAAMPPIDYIYQARVRSRWDSQQGADGQVL